MRNVSLLALAVSGLMLAGCGGSPGDSSGVFRSAGSFELCGLQEMTCDLDDDSSGSGGSGGGTVTGGGDDPNVAPDAGGSTLTAGNRTIALEKGKLVSPEVAGALSTMTRPADKSSATVAIDSKSTNNANWPRTQTLSRFASGTAGNSPFFGAPTSMTTGVTEYNEYRDSDSVLQVWDFDHSTVSAFRVTGGGEPSHKAFAVSGNATLATAMPTGGTATYSGVYGSNGTASNWATPTSQIPDIRIVDPNMVFASSGTANLNVDFGTSTINGTLTPQHWTWRTPDRAWNRYTVATDIVQWGADGTTSSNTNPADNPHITPGFFNDTINIQAGINPNSSTFSGTATLNSPGTVSSENPVYGGFFGPTLNEATGVFSVRGAYVDPFGSGTVGIDDGEGIVTHSGVFSTNCTGGTGCTP